MQKIKIFQGFPKRVESEINDWFHSNSNIIILKVLQSTISEATYNNQVCISILYSLNKN